MIIETELGKETKELMMLNKGEDFVLNLGKIKFKPEIFKDKIIFNKNIDNCVNKLNMFKQFKKNNIRHPDVYNLKTSIDYIKACYSLIKGNKLFIKPNNKVISNIIELLKIKNKTFATKVINNKKEYRVNVIGETIISVKLKEDRKRKSFLKKLENTRFKNMLVIDKELADISIKAVKSVGLDVSGVDVIFDGNKYFVLETNSCPGMGEITSKNAVTELNRLFFERVNKIPVGLSDCWIVKK